MEIAPLNLPDLLEVWLFFFILYLGAKWFGLVHQRLSRTTAFPVINSGQETSSDSEEGHRNSTISMEELDSIKNNPPTPENTQVSRQLLTCPEESDQAWATQQYVFWRSLPAQPVLPRGRIPLSFIVDQVRNDNSADVLCNSFNQVDDGLKRNLSSPKAIASSTECAICKDCFIGPHDSFVYLPCDHSFCPDCVRLWLEQTKSNHKCPLCRGDTLQHDCGHMLGRQIKAGKNITTEIINGPCYDGCPGPFGPSEIQDWLNGRQPPTQIVQWLTGEAKLPQEVLEWAQITKPYQKEILLGGDCQTQEDRFLEWFIQEVMAAAEQPIWPVWLFSEVNRRTFGLVRVRLDTQLGCYRFFEVIRQPKVQRYRGYQGLEWRQRSGELGAKIPPAEYPLPYYFHWASQRLKIEDERRRFIKRKEEAAERVVEIALSNIMTFNNQLRKAWSIYKFMHQHRVAEIEVALEDLDLARLHLVEPELLKGQESQLLEELKTVDIGLNTCRKEKRQATQKLMALERDFFHHRHRYEPSFFLALRSPRLGLENTQGALKYREWIIESLDKILQDTEYIVATLPGHCPRVWPYGVPDQTQEHSRRSEQPRFTSQDNTYYPEAWEDWNGAIPGAPIR